MANKPTTVDQYIATFPESTQAVLQKVRQQIHSVIPQATETISYGIPAFTLNNKYVVYFAGWQHHISVYPLPKGNTAFQQALAPYVAGKGTAKFLLSKPVPYPLIKDIARFLLAERHG